MTMEVGKKKALIVGHAAKIKDLSRVARNHLESIIVDEQDDTKLSSLKDASNEFFTIISAAKHIEKLLEG